MPSRDLLSCPFCSPVGAEADAAASSTRSSDCARRRRYPALDGRPQLGSGLALTAAGPERQTPRVRARGVALLAAAGD